MSRPVFESFDIRIKEALRRELDKQGVTASGRAARELRSEITDTKYTLLGVGYWKWIDAGRSKTTRRGDGTRIAKLFDWLKFRKYGLNWSTQQERLSLAFAIAKKQDKEGSFRFRNPDQRTTVVKTALDETLPQIRRLLAESIAGRIRTEILNNGDINTTA